MRRPTRALLLAWRAIRSLKIGKKRALGHAKGDLAQILRTTVRLRRLPSLAASVPDGTVAQTGTGAEAHALRAIRAGREVG